jgi:peroxiredoxin
LTGAALPATLPALTLPRLDGGVRDLAQRAGSTLLTLGHSECGTTRLLLPYVERIQRRRRPGTEVIVVLQDTPDEARALAGELGLTVPILIDAEPWAFGAALGATTVPLTLLVEAAGRIERSWPAFRRTDVEEAAARLGIGPPFFPPDDTAPALRPG